MDGAELELTHLVTVSRSEVFCEQTLVEEKSFSYTTYFLGQRVMTSSVNIVKRNFLMLPVRNGAPGWYIHFYLQRWGYLQFIFQMMKLRNRPRH